MPVLGAGTLGLILQGILAAISAAPQVEAIVTAGKNYISSLFSSGLISADTQNVLHAYVDAHWASVKAGIIPPAWQVDADPAVTPADPAVKVLPPPVAPPA